MKKYLSLSLIIFSISMIMYSKLNSFNNEEKNIYNEKSPPFKLTGLDAVRIEKLKDEQLYNPVNPFNIFINYELGMHWVLLHFMRGDDIELSIADLTKKFSYNECRDIAAKGWD